MTNYYTDTKKALADVEWLLKKDEPDDVICSIILRKYGFGEKKVAKLIKEAMKYSYLKYSGKNRIPQEQRVLK